MNDTFAKGFTFGWCGKAGDYQTEAALKSLTRLKEDGVDYVCLAFTALQETFHSTDIYYEYGVTPTDEDVIFVINKAHELGMRVCLKPIVNCKDGTWRAYISFPNGSDYWEKWFKSYTKFITHYAKIAEKYGCEMFCTGCEMMSMDAQSSYCREMIAAVRKVYSGTVMHNVNHGQEMSAEWLNLVDIVGISGYYPASDGNGYTKETMAERWTEAKKIVEETHKKYNKPVMFAEIGMRSERNCSAVPWHDDNSRNMPAEQQEQADYYDTAMAAFWSEPWFCGFFWWDWPAILYDISQAKDNRDFCIYGKLAEDVIRKWYLGNA